jgi:hypothetical protein
MERKVRMFQHFDFDVVDMTMKQYFVADDVLMQRIL